MDATTARRPRRRARSPLVALALTLTLIAAACGADEDAVAAPDPSDATDTTDAGSTDGGGEAATPSDHLGDYELIDEEFGTMVSVTVAGGTRTIETNALPDHEAGTFPNSGNPNAITAQDLTWTFPVEAVDTGRATEVRVSGVAVNGVKFEPGTAETVTCASGETYRIEALQDVYDLGLDTNNARVQPTGEYHHHGISSLLVGAYEADDDLIHIGFAADGHLMYDAKSGAYASGYRLSTEARTGADCVASGPNGTVVDLDGSTPDGTYTGDWVFDEAAGPPPGGGGSRPPGG